MPITPTYPGVYIEEIPSGVRTITGVATSITAFIGRTQRGPANDPVTINSFGDFERVFGGLWPTYPMSYAVQDFYSNGGSTAIIVRLYKESADSDGIARLSVGGLNMEAADPGEWGNQLEARVDLDNITQDVADRYGLPLADLFNLTVEDGSSGRIERFRSLSFRTDSGARRVDRVLAAESQLVRVQQTEDGDPDLPTGGPNAAEADATEGARGEALTTGADYLGTEEDKTGLFALDKADLFNLLCIPPDSRDGDTPVGVYQRAMTYCKERRAMLIVDPPAAWSANKERAATAAWAPWDCPGRTHVTLHSISLASSRPIRTARGNPTCLFRVG